MNKNNESLFKDVPIPKAVAQMAIPTVLSMLVVVIYNMVDTFFVGQTGDANQVAAVSVATPIFLIFMAFGNMFGIGGSSMISRLLGAGEPERAKHVSAFCCYASLIWGVLMVVVFLTAMPVLLTAIGTSAKIVAAAVMRIGRKRRRVPESLAAAAAPHRKSRVRIARPAHCAFVPSHG